MKKRGSFNYNYFMNNRAQVTIFIIIAIIIIVAGVFLYLFFPQIQTTFIEEKNPPGFIE
ncbi:hypothetical protein LCGC14_2700560, partial [marine sediment metagenome]